jgi:hypothetical protein
LPEITPCPADDHPVGEDALEPFCTTCGARASIFTDRRGQWLHYTGEPEDRTVHPYDPGHAPAIGWRPTPGIVVVAR